MERTEFKWKESEEYIVMTFNAAPMQKPERIKKYKKADFPFVHMRDNPGTGFEIKAELESEFFQLCRVSASLFNKKHGTRITCNKQPDGSLFVWNEATKPVEIVEPVEPVMPTIQAKFEADLVPVLQASIAVVEAAKQDDAAPNKEQFVGYVQTLTPGMSITLTKEYVHRFAEFEIWVLELEGFDTQITYNPPSLKISRKGNE